jgi:hypothetical protein
MVTQKFSWTDASKLLGKMISPPPKVQTTTVLKLLIPIVLPYMGNHAKSRPVNNYTN